MLYRLWRFGMVFINDFVAVFVFVAVYFVHWPFLKQYFYRRYSEYRRIQYRWCKWFGVLYVWDWLLNVVSFMRVLALLFCFTTSFICRLKWMLRFSLMLSRTTIEQSNFTNGLKFSRALKIPNENHCKWSKMKCMHWTKNERSYPFYRKQFSVDHPVSRSQSSKSWA